MHLARNQKHLVRNRNHLVRNPVHLVRYPEHPVGHPDYLVRTGLSESIDHSRIQRPAAKPTVSRQAIRQ